MKVIAFNASPKMDKGNTALILNPFLAGMREGGAEVELFYTKKLHVQPCQGEFNCWFKTPGSCFQNDDMQMIHPKLFAADVMVLATPLYVWGMAAPLKNVLDRIIPLFQPFFSLRNGHCVHAMRERIQPPKAVLISNCGFWEMDNFDALVHQLRDIFADRFAGALLRPHGPALASMLKLGVPVEDVLDAARQAGRELVHDGSMSQEALATVGRELLPMDQYVELVNREFQKELDRLPVMA